jgi:hypothetical protein
MVSFSTTTLAASKRKIQLHGYDFAFNGRIGLLECMLSITRWGSLIYSNII